jgi:hypothetical protein
MMTGTVSILHMRHRRRGIRLPLPGTPCVRIVYDANDQPQVLVDRTIDWDEARRRFDAVLRRP